MREIHEFTRWTTEFEAKAQARTRAGDPDWSRGVTLHPAILRSIQRFQVGESGDGANLMAKADRAGDPTYAAAVRLFIAEEQNHARLLLNLLHAAGRQPLSRHWTDAVFVHLRRALGLRLELMVLAVAEVIAVPYYRSLRDGTPDDLTTRTAALIVADEQRHIPFHTERLRQAFAPTPTLVRPLVRAAWWTILCGAITVVLLDHGPALRQLGVTRTDFARSAISLFVPICATVLPWRGCSGTHRSSPAH
ncbi:ferritin-like domain-containing protein [Nocardia sp. CDC153]|uniref:ferritin-like domain-containing protein n=1 Tax=Nocardia sp. CDC153 TaxID=3112167 RepID=UPI002DBEAE2A|nr:ferritin-like domain-containing protein [Nocardia sp. CDC153]MEC3958789.1 ferritin-like domain-containing protein [Nocardia sp. CDC153]